MDVREKLIDIVERASARTLPKNTCHTNIVMLVNELIEEGVTVQDWIPVTERLPERTGSYIVCTDGGAICTAKFYGDLPIGLRYEEPHWNNSRLNKHITHWCYLPQPPKGD